MQKQQRRGKRVDLAEMFRGQIRALELEQDYLLSSLWDAMERAEVEEQQACKDRLSEIRIEMKSLERHIPTFA